jgi:alpha,alpha-trehalase
MGNKLREFIKEGWGKARTVVDFGLKVPYPAVPPCIVGDFRTLYYWDTYFTNIGLIVDGYLDWAKENVENLLYALHHFGCVPNYLRSDGADYCSQPPLLSLMVQDIYALTKDDAWLARAVEGLEIEYAFWMRERITPIGLNQYGCNAETEDLLVGYYEYVSERISLPQDISTESKMLAARNFVAEAESGQDYNPRYENHNSLDYVQIDLNSHLYGMEKFLYEYFKDVDAKKAAFYYERMQTRVALMEKYCYDAEKGFYCDYDFVKGKRGIAATACFLPYFYGYAKNGDGLKNLYKLLKTNGGVTVCQDVGVSGYQWGYPYLWPPCQYFAYRALKNYGHDDLAKELRDNFTRLLSNTFDKTGVLWERYDENGNAPDLEYPTQMMLGWTAGVYRYFESIESK